MLRHNHFIILLFTTLIALSGAASAKSPVWKISKGNNHLFIGGTIHLLATKDYPLPEAFDHAFDQSDEIVFETDISSANDLATQMKMMPVIMSQSGETLESRLNPKTWEELSMFMEARGLPIPMFQAMTPAGFNLTLLVLELQKMDVTSKTGVETFFNQKAISAGKSISWLETLEAQLSVINTMNEIDANVVVRSTIEDIKKLPEKWPELLRVWRAGDMRGLENLTSDQILETSPVLHEALLVQRNKNWLPSIEKMLESKGIELVLVGALHLSGQHSLLKMLSDGGATVEQLN